MKFRFLLVFLVLALLSSCSSSTEEKTISSISLYENNYFSINYPESWEVLTWTSNVLPEPKNGEISLAVSSPDLKYWFSNNLLVLKQDLHKVVSSTDFSILNNVWSTTQYLEYTKLESKTIDFSDWDKSNLYVFEAKYNTSTPRLKFLQTWKVCNVKNWYLLTIAVSTDIKDIASYEDILKSFNCKWN